MWQTGRDDGSSVSLASLLIHTRPSVGGTCSVTLGALHAALDPVERLHARRRIDAFGGEILNIDQIDPLQVRIIFGSTEGNRLDCSMAVGELPLNEAAGRLPFHLL